MTPKIRSSNPQDDKVNISTRKQILLSAVKSSSLGSLKKLIVMDDLKHDNTWFDYELLIAAFQRKHKTIIRFLLIKNCRVRRETKTEASTPLHYAVKIADVSIVKRLLRLNASILDKDENQETPFDLAVKAENDDIVEAMLLSYDFKNANVNNEEKIYCFHYACKKNNLSFIKKFIDLGFPINSHASPKIGKLFEGFTPLHFAVYHESLETIIYLLKHEVSVTEKNNQGDTPLNYAFYEQPKNDAIINLLLPVIPKDAICADSRGLSHFHIACTRNDLNTVELFLQYGNLVGLQIKSDEYIYPGYTPLHLAVEYNRVDVVKVLLENGADVNKKTSKGETALHIACTHSIDKWYELIDSVDLNEEVCNNIDWISNRMDQNSIIQLLLDYKADVNAKDSNNETPLIRVCNISEENILNHDQSFQEQKKLPVYSSILKEINQRILEIIKILLNYNADVNTCTKNQESVLHLIIKKKMEHSLVLAKELLNKGFRLQTVDKGGYTVLHWAAMINYNKELVELFLDHNANVNAKSKCLETPLHLSLGHKENNEVIVDLLLRNGADVNAQNRVNSTPLHAAFYFQNYQVVKQLLHYGADINLKDKFDYTSVESFSLVPSSDSTFNESFNVLQLIKNHIEKLKALGLFVSEEVLQHLQYLNDFLLEEICPFNNFVYQDDISHLCSKELETLKHLKIDGSIDLYSILHKNKKEMAKLIEDENLVYTLASIDETNFPLYGYLLKLQLVKGIKAAVLLEQFPNSLKFLTDLDRFKLCIDHISKHFNKEDLDSLIMTGHINISF